jgi:hypothetical protein
MNETPFTTLLCRDAASQVIASPAASHCWHRLIHCVRQIDDEAIKSALVAELLAQTPDAGVAGFLRATWLVSLRKDDAALYEAGRLVCEIAPFDPDRVMAFLVFAWSHILNQSGDTTAFVRAIRAACFPPLLHRLGQTLVRQTPPQLVRRQIDRVRRVAVVTPCLSAHSHAPTATALHQARILAEHGMQVELFCCHDLMVPGMMHFLGAGETTSLAPFDAASWGALCPPGLRIHQGRTDFSVSARWVGMLEHLAGFDPDLILSVGLFSPLVAALFEVRPVLAHNVHAVAPLDPVDVWLCADALRAGQMPSEWEGGPGAAVGWHHPFRVRRAAPASALSRQQLGLPETSLVLVSVGYRLDTEINGAWAACMVELLRRQPQVTWLLVGGAGTLPPALATAPASQVRLLSARDDIGSVLACCDIYVNPPRMGGGFSVAEAMGAGLPVVSYANSDGGRKVGAAAVGGDAAYLTTLLGLIDSADARAREGAVMRALFASTLDLDQSGPSLLAACELALQRFQQRSDGG